MRKEYNVAGHRFAVVFPDNCPVIPDMSQYEPFAVEASDSVVFTLDIVDSLPEISPEIVLDQPTEPGETKIKLFRCEGGWYCESSPTASHPVAAKLLMSADFRSAKLEVSYPKMALFALNNSLMLMYAFRTADMKTLEMHASVIAHGGKSYLFLAKSGTGKSTQSSMWLKAIEGARLLNDDNPIVRILPDGEVRAYGSPWSGKTACYINESYPVGAFVNIRRAPENRMTRLSILESYVSIYSSCSGFKADERMGDGIHESISAAIAGVPCFVLDCLPNEDAARVCCKAVKEADEK